MASIRPLYNVTIAQNHDTMVGKHGVFSSHQERPITCQKPSIHQLMSQIDEKGPLGTFSSVLALPMASIRPLYNAKIAHFFCLHFQKTVKFKRRPYGRPLMGRHQPAIGSPCGLSPFELHCFFGNPDTKNILRKHQSDYTETCLYIAAIVNR